MSAQNLATEIRYTDQQRVAVNTRDVSIALEAGAGCGKTFVLTERFLSQLQPSTGDALPTELSELIAITFTDAAAREMRDRIRTKCLERLEKADAKEGDYWLALMRSLDTARISTIHAFCGTLIRAHAVELGLDPDFQVLDQAAADVLQSQAIDQALRKRLDDEDATVLQLAADLGIQRLKSHLATLVDQSRGPQFQHWLAATPQQLVDAWRQAYVEQAVPSYRSRLVPLTNAAAEILQAWDGDSPKLAPVRAELLPLLQGLAESPTFLDDLQQIRNLAKIQGVTKAADWPDKTTYEEYRDRCAELRKRIDAVKPLANEAELQASAVACLQILRLANEAAKSYGAVKQSYSSLDYEDLMAEARRLLVEPEFESLQRRIRQQTRLLMVDEFQDTNQSQVDIVRALVGEGFAAGKLFFVGDCKQSIYRFRGAEPSVFRDLQTETPAAGRLPLTKNFRTQPHIIEFVNDLFSGIFSEDYLPLQAAREQTTSVPAVEFLWTPVERSLAASDARRAEAQTIAQRLKTLIEEQQPIVVGKDDAGEPISRPAQPGDIAILFSALSDVKQYEEALRDAGLEYYLVGGHAFYSQQEIFDILNLLRSLASNCDEVSLAGLLRSPFFSLQDETLYWLCQSAGSLNAALRAKQLPKELSSDERAKVERAATVIKQLRQERTSLSIAALLQAAFDATGYDATLLTEFLGERKLANLNKLLEQARRIEQLGGGQLDAFIRQLTEFTVRQPKEALAATKSGDSDVIRLMTVHGSKGLEFPVVVVADMHRKTQADKTAVAIDPRLGPVIQPADTPESGGALGIDLYKLLEADENRAEKHRSFYVACTRAADYLILSGATTGDLMPDGSWLQTLSEHYDINSGSPASGKLPEGPLVTIGGDNESGGGGSKAGRQKPLDELLAEARSSKAGRDNHLATALPIPLNPEQIKRFSVSRLTGQLRDARSWSAQQKLSSLLAPTTGEKVDPRGLGNLVHAVLERLTFTEVDRNHSDWTERLAPLNLRRHAGRAAEQTNHMLERFLRSPRYEDLCKAKQVIQEAEFLMNWPPSGQAEAYLQGYLDCLWQDAAGDWRLIDYKTTTLVAADGEPDTMQAVAKEKAEEYRLQLEVYALAVEGAYGVRPREMYLYFLKPGVEVVFDWNETARAEAIDRIAQAISDARQAAVASH